MRNGFIVLLFLFLFPVFAHAIMYGPGETLEPSCAPTDSGCGVIAPVFTDDTLTDGAVLYANNGEWLLLGAGTDGQVLKVAGGLPSWGNDNGGTSYSAGAGLNLSGAQFALDISSLPAESIISNNDTLAIYDDSAGTVKKITRSNFLSGITGALVYQGTWNANTT